jgi:hypothetical protein
MHNPARKYGELPQAPLRQPYLDLVAAVVVHAKMAP